MFVYSGKKYICLTGSDARKVATHISQSAIPIVINMIFKKLVKFEFSRSCTWTIHDFLKILNSKSLENISSTAIDYSYQVFTSWEINSFQESYFDELFFATCC